MRVIYLFCLLIYSLACWAQPDTSGTVNFEMSPGKSAILIELQPSFFKRESVSNLSRYSPFDHQETKVFLQQHFDCYRLTTSDRGSSILFELYRPRTFPTFYLLDQKKRLLAVSEGLNKTLNDFQHLKDSADKKLELYRRLDEYQLKADQQNISKKELQKLIELRLAMNMLDNGELIEQFAKMMSDADANDPDLVLLIFKSGYIYNGKAHQMAYKNKTLYNQVYKEHYKNYKPNFNQRMHKNSLAFAIKTRDEGFAQRLAGMYQSRYHKSKKDVTPMNPWVLMTYYKGVRDTSNYLKQLVANYEPLLQVSADSAFRYDENMNSKEKPTATPKGAQSGNMIKFLHKYTYSNQLDYAATQILENSKDPDFLKQGIEFCRHAIVLANDNYRPRVTLAKLLAVSGFTSEAKKTQWEAIQTGNLSADMQLRLFEDLEKISNPDME